MTHGSLALNAPSKPTDRNGATAGFRDRIWRNSTYPLDLRMVLVISIFGQQTKAGGLPRGEDYARL